MLRFRQVVSDKIKKLKLTQSEVSRYCGINNSNLSNVLLGLSCPTTDKLKLTRLAEILQLSPDELIKLANIEKRAWNCSFLINRIRNSSYLLDLYFANQQTTDKQWNDTIDKLIKIITTQTSAIQDK